jgi:squalene synthase HpnC
MARQGQTDIASSPTLSQAYAHCSGIARSHYENFTVGSLFLPREFQSFLYVIYAFCRHTDDLGDEADGDRLAYLDAWEQELNQCYTGTPEHPIMVALQDTIRRFNIPDAPFRKLIEANRIDQRQRRFATYNDLLFYCQHSAEPVGRMVLYVLGYRDEERQRLSDATCTALQLANFWQDVQRDWVMGRVYIPQEDMARFGYTEQDLAQGVVDDRFRDLMRFEVDRAEAFFHQGEALVDTLTGTFKLDIALFTKGGLSVLDAIRRRSYDVLSSRPRVSKARKIWLMLSTAARLLVLRRA